MRISVSSWATTDDDVTRSVDAMRRVASRRDIGGEFGSSVDPGVRRKPV